MVTNSQLCLMIGVPILANAAMIGLLMACIDTKFDGVNRRVEEARDARLKHLEER